MHCHGRGVIERVLDELYVRRVVELAGKRRDGAGEADVGGREGGSCGAVRYYVHLQRLAFRRARRATQQWFWCKGAARRQHSSSYSERHHHWCCCAGRLVQKWMLHSVREVRICACGVHRQL